MKYWRIQDMKRISVLVLLAFSLCAEAPALGEGAPASDPIAAALISPDVIMSHQDGLGLSEAQRNAIRSDALSAQGKFSSLQWQLSAATEKLATLLGATHVEQARAIAALDSVLALERELKHTQLTLMIQLKNELTPDQQKRARQLGAGH
jgi:Spy/CpxP family protein refolding chaperone